MLCILYYYIIVLLLFIINKLRYNDINIYFKNKI